MALNTDLPLNISKDNSTAIKGVLICLVMLGHNQYFTQALPYGCFEWLYCFHVSAFFILPFLYKDHAFSWSRTWSYFKRLMWPYTYMFVSLFLLNIFLHQKGQFDLGLLNTYITGNFYTLRTYIGGQYLWFLPAMFSMLVMKDLTTNTGKKTKALMLSVSVIFFFCFWVFLYRCPYDKVVNLTLAKFSLFSFMLGLAMMLLGSWAKKSFIIKKMPPILSALIMVLLLVFILVTEQTPSHNYVVWSCRFIGPIIGFAFLYHIPWGKMSLLKQIGKLSLPIYLFHQPIYASIYPIIQKSDINSALSLILTFCVALLLSYSISKIIMAQERIQLVLFPR